MASGLNTNFLVATNPGKTYDLGGLLSATNTDAVSFSPNQPANQKMSVAYTTPASIKTSNISAKIDGPIYGFQTVYFGPTQPPLWVAGGYDGPSGNTIAISTDGINWIGQPMSVINAVYAVDYDGAKWVATGNSATSSIAYSYDATVWYAGTDVFPRVANSTGGALVYNGSVWVGAGSGGGNALAYSYDGINWIGLGVGVLTKGYGLATNGNVWVAVGTGTNTIAYTADLTGTTGWTGVTGTAIFSTSGNSVKWNGRTFVAVGTGTATIGISVDGITWTSLTSSPSITTVNGLGWDGVNWLLCSGATAPTLFVTQGQQVATVASMTLTSADRVFTAATGCFWNGSVWVATGTSNAG